MKILVLPDVQAKPDTDFSFLTSIGNYILAKKPDVIVNIGDFADMPSLSMHEHSGTKSMEGKRYKADIWAAREAMDALLTPFPQINDEYKLTVVAFRVDGQKLAGCYKKLDENFIEIQWHKGDKTVIPANAFLQPDSTKPLPNVNIAPTL